MKRTIIYIAIFFVAALSLSSCQIEGGDYQPDNSGYNMFLAWNFANNNVNTVYMNMAFLFNDWLKAGDNPIYGTFLEYEVHQVSDNVWNLEKEGLCKFVIETNGLFLEAENAQWKITQREGFILDMDGYHINETILYYEHASFVNGNTVVEIQTLQPYKWHVQITPSGWGSNGVFADMTISIPSQVMPRHLDDVEYELTGSGRYAFVNDKNNSATIHGTVYSFAYLDFQIEEPMLSSADHWDRWKSGTIKLIGHVKDKTNSCVATVKEDNLGGHYLEILTDGSTEFTVLM